MLPCFQLIVPSQLDADIIVHESTNFYLATHQGQVQTISYTDWKDSPTEWIWLSSGYIVLKSDPTMMLWENSTTHVLELRQDKATAWKSPLPWHGSAIPNQTVLVDAAATDVWYVPKQIFFPNYPGWKMKQNEQSYLTQDSFYMWCPSEIDLHGSFVSKLNNFTLVQQKGLDVILINSSNRTIQFQPIFTTGNTIQTKTIADAVTSTWVNRLYNSSNYLAYRATPTIQLVDPSLADSWSYDPIHKKVFTLVQGQIYFYGDTWDIGEYGELIGSDNIVLPSGAWHAVSTNLYINMPSVISRQTWEYLARTSVYDLLNDSQVDIYKYSEPVKFDAASLTWKTAWTSTDPFVFKKSGADSYFTLLYRDQALNSSLFYGGAGSDFSLTPGWYLPNLFSDRLILVIRSVNNQVRSFARTGDLRPDMQLSLLYRQKDMSKRTFLTIYTILAFLIILCIVVFCKTKKKKKN